MFPHLGAFVVHLQWDAGLLWAYVSLNSACRTEVACEHNGGQEAWGVEPRDATGPSNIGPDRFDPVRQVFLDATCKVLPSRCQKIQTHEIYIPWERREYMVKTVHFSRFLWFSWLARITWNAVCFSLMSVREGAIETSRRTGTALRMIAEKIALDAAGHANFFCFRSCRVSKVIETHQCSLDVRHFVSFCHMFLTEYQYPFFIAFLLTSTCLFDLVWSDLCTVRLYKVQSLEIFAALAQLGLIFAVLWRCGAHQHNSSWLFAWSELAPGCSICSPCRYHETCVPQSGEAPSEERFQLKQLTELTELQRFIALPCASRVSQWFPHVSTGHATDGSVLRWSPQMLRPGSSLTEMIWGLLSTRSLALLGIAHCLALLGIISVLFFFVKTAIWSWMGTLHTAHSVSMIYTSI